ncbi:hypothetical protein HOG48_04770 [Candidatus Peregrinibacteria bacterium]|jgi:hypothetical protein|nr:hypothetical protein [Candidatus Peregrinibacteria bacterium]
MPTAPPSLLDKKPEEYTPEEVVIQMFFAKINRIDTEPGKMTGEDPAITEENWIRNSLAPKVCAIKEKLGEKKFKKLMIETIAIYEGPYLERVISTLAKVPIKEIAPLLEVQKEYEELGRDIHPAFNHPKDMLRAKELTGETMQWLIEEAVQHTYKPETRKPFQMLAKYLEEFFPENDQFDLVVKDPSADPLDILDNPFSEESWRKATLHPEDIREQEWKFMINEEMVNNIKRLKKEEARLIEPLMKESSKNSYLISLTHLAHELGILLTIARGIVKLRPHFIEDLITAISTIDRALEVLRAGKAKPETAEVWTVGRIEGIRRGSASSHTLRFHADYDNHPLTSGVGKQKLLCSLHDTRLKIIEAFKTDFRSANSGKAIRAATARHNATMDAMLERGGLGVVDDEREGGLTIAQITGGELELLPDQQ